MATALKKRPLDVPGEYTSPRVLMWLKKGLYTVPRVIGLCCLRADWACLCLSVPSL